MSATADLLDFAIRLNGKIVAHIWSKLPIACYRLSGVICLAWVDDTRSAERLKSGSVDVLPEGDLDLPESVDSRGI